MSARARWRCSCRMEMAERRARASGLASRVMGTGAGGGAVTWLGWVWVKVWRGVKLGPEGSLTGARVGVMGLTGGRMGELERE
jgi:hypothetical protein